MLRNRACEVVLDFLVFRSPVSGSREILCRPLWQPTHQSPALASNNVVAMPVAERLAPQGLSLPCWVGPTESEQDRVIAALVELGK